MIKPSPGDRPTFDVLAEQLRESHRTTADEVLDAEMTAPDSLVLTKHIKPEK